MTELEKAREEINRIDRQLARLFEERMAAVKTVAEYKRQNGVRVTDLSREAEVIKRNSSLIENEALKPYFVSFLQSNMDISKAYQHRLLEVQAERVPEHAHDAAAFAAHHIERDAVHGGRRRADGHDGDAEHDPEQIQDDQIREPRHKRPEWGIIIEQFHRWTSVSEEISVLLYRLHRQNASMASEGSKIDKNTE